IFGEAAVRCEITSRWFLACIGWAALRSGPDYPAARSEDLRRGSTLACHAAAFSRGDLTIRDQAALGRAGYWVYRNAITGSEIAGNEIRGVSGGGHGDSSGMEQFESERIGPKGAHVTHACVYCKVIVVGPQSKLRRVLHALSQRRMT